MPEPYIDMSKILFKEELYLPRSWVMGIMLFSFGIPAVFIAKELSERVKSVNADIAPLCVVLSFVVVLGGIISWLLLKKRLTLEVTKNSILIKHAPLGRKCRTIGRDDVVDFVVERRKDILKSGIQIPYRYRKMRNRAQVYNINGYYLLVLFLNDNTEVYIGTRKRRALEHAMGKLMGKVE